VTGMGWWRVELVRCGRFECRRFDFGGGNEEDLPGHGVVVFCSAWRSALPLLARAELATEVRFGSNDDRPEGSAGGRSSRWGR
jgi:hypothetical protein